MKRISILIVIAALGFVTLHAGPAHARTPKKKLAKQVGGKKLLPRPVLAPLARPIILKPVMPPAQLKPVTPVPVAAKPYIGPEVGLAAGLFAALPSVAGEVRFHKLLGIDGTALKAGLRYAEGKDADQVNRKSALVFADGIINLNGGPGAIFYLGGGLNYLAYTTGRTGGTAGGEVYLGVQEGSLYGEAGYSAIRTGFSPSYKGLNLNLGLKWIY
jgi:hypothetical protein